jgi:anti-anti-sigma factor
MNVLIRDGMASVQLPGQLDGTSTAAFKSRIRSLLGDRSIHGIDLDFAAVEYMDSMALGALLLSRERILAAGKTLTLSALRPRVKGLFALANIQKLFDIR